MNATAPQTPSTTAPEQGRGFLTGIAVGLVIGLFLGAFGMPLIESKLNSGSVTNQSAHPKPGSNRKPTQAERDAMPADNQPGESKPSEPAPADPAKPDAPKSPGAAA